MGTESLGEIMFVRARYGHGGRVGYEREWRADPKLSGGGELIDQGVHLIDWPGCFLANSRRSMATPLPHSGIMPVDDNAFLSLRTAQGKNGLVACKLHGMEKSLLVRDLLSARQAARRRPGRKLWLGAIDLL